MRVSSFKTGLANLGLAMWARRPFLLRPFPYNRKEESK